MVSLVGPCNYNIRARGLHAQFTPNNESNSTHKCTSCRRWDHAANRRHSGTYRIRQCSHRSSGHCTGRFLSDTRLCLKVGTKLYLTICSYIRLAKLKIQLNHFCCYSVCVCACVYVCVVHLPTISAAFVGFFR